MEPVVADGMEAVGQIKPFSLGSVMIDPPLFLAPMAGHTNVGFRTLVRELGSCGLVCSELISSHALEVTPQARKTTELFDWSPREFPFAVQLFGADPEEMGKAAKIVVDRGASIVDINMGCWVPKVAKKGCGAALLGDLPRARAVVAAVCQAVDVPVTVKIRLGLEPGNPTAVPFAMAAADLGAQLITVHGRYARQGFQGESDHAITAEIRRQLPENIKVVANGDIVDLSSARAVLAQTSCDGLMIGRAALRKPWIFRELAVGLCADSQTSGSFQPLEIAERHVKLAQELIDKPEAVLVRELRGQLLPYRLGAPLGDTSPERGPVEESLRQALVKAKTFQDLATVLKLARDFMT